TLPAVGRWVDSLGQRAASSPAVSHRTRDWIQVVSVHLFSRLAPPFVVIHNPSRRQFDFEILQRGTSLIHQAHGPLPTVLFVDNFENDNVDALLQGDAALVSIEHQSTWFAEHVNTH